MGAFFKFLGLLIVLAGVGALCIAIYAFDYERGEGPLTEPKVIMFERGHGFQSMVDEIEKQGVIDNKQLFMLAAIATGRAREFKAGEYKFTEKMTPHAIITMISTGKVLQHKFTVPEGLNVREITKLLQAEPAMEGDVQAGIPEGSLLPETYQFAYGFKRAEMIALMQKAMRTTLDAAWAKRQQNLPYDTPDKALVMASIIEKETGLPKERPHVASVFINRLRKGIKLQTDPTVAYGVEQALGGPMGRPLTTVDLQTATPYNTYMIDGLPQGPICNPGKASLEAAINPVDSDDLYFVATGSGGHNFAATLEQHNANVAHYRAKMRQ